MIFNPNAWRDFHADPSDEFFFMLRGDTTLELMREGRCRTQVIREGKLLLKDPLGAPGPRCR